MLIESLTDILPNKAQLVFFITIFNYNVYLWCRFLQNKTRYGGCLKTRIALFSEKKKKKMRS
jgi:hypothetical protein